MDACCSAVEERACELENLLLVLLSAGLSLVPHLPSNDNRVALYPGLTRMA